MKKQCERNSRRMCIDEVQIELLEIKAELKSLGLLFSTIEDQIEGADGAAAYLKRTSRRIDDVTEALNQIY